MKERVRDNVKGKRRLFNFQRWTAVKAQYDFKILSYEQRLQPAVNSVIGCRQNFIVVIVQTADAIVVVFVFGMYFFIQLSSVSSRVYLFLTAFSVVPTVRLNVSFTSSTHTHIFIYMTEGKCASTHLVNTVGNKNTRYLTHPHAQPHAGLSWSCRLVVTHFGWH